MYSKSFVKLQVVSRLLSNLAIAFLVAEKHTLVKDVATLCHKLGATFFLSVVTLYMPDILIMIGVHSKLIGGYSFTN